MEKHVLEAFWQPFTATRQFRSHPKLFANADGMYYETTDGKTILDGCAGLWCVNAGHNHPDIVKAVQESVANLDYASCFQLGHPKAFELCEKLAQKSPGQLNQVFLSNSGSEAVDTALKVVATYQKAKGKTGKVHYVGRELAYHGVGFGGISVGGMPLNREGFPLLSHVSHLPHTHSLEHNAFSRGLPKWGKHLADDLLNHIEQYGDISAVIVEPLSGSSGVLLPPEGYLERLREICTEHDILLIFDEVITAFGRVHGTFASDYFGVTPDIITVAKGLTNAAVPMGATLVHDDIYDTIVNSTAEDGIGFFHGYTYSGHPLACSAALATLEVHEKEDLAGKNAAITEYWQDAAHKLSQLNQVVDVRALGLIAAVELAPIEGRKPAMEVFHKAFEAGILVRPNGNNLAFSPPLIINKKQVDTLFNILYECIASL
jgi:beta-alanine--pyruvate transaminase